MLKVLQTARAKRPLCQLGAEDMYSMRVRRAAGRSGSGRAAPAEGALGVRYPRSAGRGLFAGLRGAAAAGLAWARSVPKREADGEEGPRTGQPEIREENRPTRPSLDQICLDRRSRGI